MAGLSPRQVFTGQAMVNFRQTLPTRRVVPATDPIRLNRGELPRPGPVEEAWAKISGLAPIHRKLRRDGGLPVR